MRSRMCGLLRLWPGAQYALGNGGHVELVEAGQDEIRACFPQQRFVSEACDTECGHAAGACSLDPRGRVFHDEALHRWGFQSFCGEQKDRRIWLAARHVATTQIGIKNIEERPPVSHGQTA